MLRRISKLAALALSLGPAFAAAEATSLDVEVIGAMPASGTVEISLFRTDEMFLKEADFQQQCKPSDEGICSVRFLLAMPGDYAVVVAHDANDNQKLDNGFLGFGAERFAYSNNASNPLFGRASFDDVKIEVSGETRITIDLD